MIGIATGGPPKTLTGNVEMGSTNLTAHVRCPEVSQDNPGTQPAASIPVDMPLIDGHVEDEPFSGIGGTSGFLRMSLEAVK